MPSVIAIVGRPNVGKSTLFNRLTRRRDALVAAVPGLTRDRKYGFAEIAGRPVTLIDTGGMGYQEDRLRTHIEAQAETALGESDLVLFVVDGRAGATATDEELLARLRRRDVPVLLLINKIDGASDAAAIAEFAHFGLGDPLLVSAAHGRGMSSLGERILAALPATRADESAPPPADAIPVAVIGRPNVGKSTLVNRILGEERQVVFDVPGTTRDSVYVPFESAGQDYVLIDTAGIRRKGRVEGVAEKFSVVKALEAARIAEVVLLVIDAREGLVDQDLHLLGAALDAGSGLILVVNKWDGLEPDIRRAVKRTLDRRLDFAPWIRAHFISALHGTGVGRLLDNVRAVHETGRFEVSTPVLTRLLAEATTAHPPPMVRGRAIKLRYAHKQGAHPPTVMIHGNQTGALPAGYVRYLENFFRERLDLAGVPVRILLKTAENPYAGRRNVLTARQQRRRRRIVKHRKARKR